MTQVFSLRYNMVTVPVLVSWRNGQIFGWMQDVRILADCYFFLLDASKKLNSDGANHLAENQFFTQVCPCYRTVLGASSYNCNLTTPPVMVSQHFWFVDLGRHFSGHNASSFLLRCMLVTYISYLALWIFLRIPSLPSGFKNDMLKTSGLLDQFPLAGSNYFCQLRG